MRKIVVLGLVAIGAGVTSGAFAAGASLAGSRATDNPPKQQPVKLAFFENRAVPYWDFGPIRLRSGDRLGSIWLFANGPRGQLAVVEAVPGTEDLLRAGAPATGHLGGQCDAADSSLCRRSEAGACGRRVADQADEHHPQRARSRLRPEGIPASSRGEIIHCTSSARSRSGGATRSFRSGRSRTAYRASATSQRSSPAPPTIHRSGRSSKRRGGMGRRGASSARSLS